MSHFSPASLTPERLREATLTLAEQDPELGAIVGQHGVPPMWGREPGFGALFHIILEQQVSQASALTLFRRISAELGDMTPERVAERGTEGLRALGLTRQKAHYCDSLARRVLAGTLDLDAIHRAPDEWGRQQLLALPGLGPWSVDVYYLMALKRPDIWPQGDLALAVALHSAKSLPARPDRGRQLELAQAWAPWRSVAARILWMHYLAEQGKYPLPVPGATPG